MICMICTCLPGWIGMIYKMCTCFARWGPYDLDIVHNISIAGETDLKIYITFYSRSLSVRGAAEVSNKPI